MAGYGVLYIMKISDAKVQTVRKAMVDKRYYKFTLKKKDKSGKTIPAKDSPKATLSQAELDEMKPSFLKMPNPKPRTKFWAWALGPDLPNKQEMLFWLDKKGPHFVFFLVRQMVLMLSIYLAVIVMHIGPVAIETFFGENAIPVKVIGCAYLLMTFYPLRGLQTY